MNETISDAAPVLRFGPVAVHLGAVIGLYAASNPIRSGPYNSRQWCVDRYDAAARKFLGKPAAALPWGRKLEFPGVMDLIEPEAVTERLDALMAWRTAQGEA